MMSPYPLQFTPVLKRTIWGGRRLGQQLGKPLGPESDYAESWEVVDHGDDQSLVENGPLTGTSLAQLMANHRRWLLGDDVPSRPVGNRDVFPLLLKYLDCNRVLSVQVHPDDAYALRMDPPDLGKTEAWYIVASDAGSLIYAGLKEGVDRSALHEAIEAGQTEQVLHAFHPNSGDVVFIPAGTVHALGAGLLVAEIQQSSDTTFRLFDWNRLDAGGKARPLHIEQSLEVSDYTSGPVAPRRCDPLRVGLQMIVESDKFVLHVIARGQDVIAGNGKFHIVTVPQGTAILRSEQDVMTLTAGTSVLLPAAMPRSELSVDGDSAALVMHLPD